MKNIFILALLLAFAAVSHAQSLKDRLKKGVSDLNTKENRDKIADAGVERLQKYREKMDSADIDYAVLVSDNAAFQVLKAQDAASMAINTGDILYKTKFKNENKSEADLARTDLSLGEFAYTQSWFVSAENFFRKAEQSFEKNALTSDISYLKTLTSEALLYAVMGRYTQAEEYSQKALDARTKKYGEQHVSLASSLNNLAVLKYNEAQYNASEKHIDNALALLRDNGFQASMQYAIVSNNKAMLYQSIGRYEEAEKLLKEAIAEAEKSSKSNNALKFLSNLALLYQQDGKFNEAEAIYLGMEKKLGGKTTAYATMLGNQAALYMAMGKEDKVEELLKKASSIFKSNLTEQSPAYAKSLNDLGNFYRYKERYAEAETNLDKALAIREVTLGKKHPLYVQSQEDIAILHWKKKAWNKAFMMYRDVMDASIDFVNTYFPPMSEAEKTKYWDLLSPRFQRFYNFAVESNLENPHEIAAMYEYHIATKALLLNSTNKVKELILNSKNPTLIADYKTWLDQKETLARLYAYSKSELQEQRINLDSIQRAANAMERKLSASSAEFSSGYSTKKINYTQVRDQLADNEAIVEIIRLVKFGQKFTDEVNYAALVITKGAEVPKLVLLDNGKLLETRFSKFYRNAIQQRIADDYSYEQYWSRIETEIGAKKVIYFSPDGVYSQLNVNTFKKPSGEVVLNKFDIMVLGNSKDLIVLKGRKAKTTKKNATLIGFPDYGQGDISPLPGTKVEIDGISKTLKAAAYQITSFQAKNATEAKIKSLKGPAILHIATHGYFLKDVDRERSAFGVQMENADDNPLLKSGLLLAGAASTASGKRVPDLGSNDNGVLTAYEAMNLNLEGTDLVVLSACETGLGEVKAGEGVYGLQRAFLVAGADALIMSLWKVDDAATQQLMTNFYTNLIKLGNKQKAFKQAQLQLMAKYKDPYYWGAFVMMGQ